MSKFDKVYNKITSTLNEVFTNVGGNYGTTQTTQSTTGNPQQDKNAILKAVLQQLTTSKAPQDQKDLQDFVSALDKNDNRTKDAIINKRVQQALAQQQKTGQTATQTTMTAKPAV